MALAHCACARILAALLALFLLLGNVEAVTPKTAPKEHYPIDILFSPSGGIKDKLSKLIQNAQSSIVIAAYNVFLPDVSLSLLGAKARGVKIRVVMDNDAPSAKNSDYPLLRTNQIGVHTLTGGGSGRMHHSFAIFDGKLLAVGSFEWTEVGENENLDSMLFTGDPDAAKTYSEKFESLWGGG